MRCVRAAITHTHTGTYVCGHKLYMIPNASTDADENLDRASYGDQKENQLPHYCREALVNDALDWTVKS